VTIDRPDQPWGLADRFLFIIKTMTLGENLRRKREEKGITLEKASQETKIRIQFLQAIENGEMDRMPSPTQAKGFARLYASFLGMDERTLFDDEIISSYSSSNNSETGISEENAEEISRHVEEPVSKPKKAVEPIQENSNPRARFKDLIPKEKELNRSSQVFKQIGEELRQQRESLGLTLADVERLTKIREIYLYSLEQGNVDALPSTVQGRGILNNYSNFLSIDPVKIQNKFAEGLQQKRLETAAVELTSFDGKTVTTKKTPVTGWRRFLTIDLLVGTSVLVILSVLVIWGAIQVIGSSHSVAEPTIDSISDILVNPGTETGSVETSGSPEVTLETAQPTQGISTVPVDILATITSVNTGSIQLVVVALQRSYLKVTSDGKEVFNGRIIPGNVYTFTGSTRILLNSGNAGGIQIYFNQNDMGILGMVGEVISLEFTSKGYVTSTPMFTPSPTATLPPTLTQRATVTPTVTPTIPTPTITPKTTVN
jgi:cytoskeleton protein RodZ